MSWSQAPERLLILASKTKIKILGLLLLLSMRVLATKSTSSCAVRLEGLGEVGRWLRLLLPGCPSGEVQDVRFIPKESLEEHSTTAFAQ